jgi:serine/threonine-protein kinase HipA
VTTLEVRLADATLIEGETLVGSLTRAQSRSGDAIRFAYDGTWLNHAATPRAYALDPDLPLFRGDFHPPRGLGLHGVFLDMSPDRWGRVLMERREAIEARDEGREARILRDWDFLVGVNDATRMGALRLHDATSGRNLDVRELGAPPLARLRELEDIVARLELPDAEDRPEYRHWLRMLVLPGTSLGGARPKASFTDEDGAMWIAKFPAGDDRRDVGLLEFLVAELARRAAIELPPSRRYRFSARGHTFAVRRFDRRGATRRAYASSMTLLQRRDGEPASYLELAQAIESVGDPAFIRADLEQLYRRILFSILVGNRDDHLRNHGFLRAPGGWRLSPAFDINANPDKDIHALAIDAGDPRPDSAHLRATAAFYRLDARQSAAIETEVRDVVRDWRTLARDLGVNARDQALLASLVDADR